MQRTLQQAAEELHFSTLRRVTRRHREQLLGITERYQTQKSSQDLVELLDSEIRACGGNGITDPVQPTHVAEVTFLRSVVGS